MAADHGNGQGHLGLFLGLLLGFPGLFLPIKPLAVLNVCQQSIRDEIGQRAVLFIGEFLKKLLKFLVGFETYHDAHASIYMVKRGL